MKTKTRIEVRRELAAGALGDIRKLMKKYDLAAVQAAVKMLYDEKAAQRKLKEAEANVQALKRKLGV